MFYLGMCAFASRSLSVDRGRPFGHWLFMGLSCDVILWLQPSFPPGAPSLSFSFSFAPSFARPLCSARRTLNCFLRPGTARRWVKEWVCNKKQTKRFNLMSKIFLCGLISIKCRFLNESIDLGGIHNAVQTYTNTAGGCTRRGLNYVSLNLGQFP